MMEEKITEIMIYYYLVYQRKLWLFYNNISMEEENELVQIGKFIDNSSYSSKGKTCMWTDRRNYKTIGTGLYICERLHGGGRYNRLGEGV